MQAIVNAQDLLMHPSSAMPENISEAISHLAQLSSELRGLAQRLNALNSPSAEVQRREVVEGRRHIAELTQTLYDLLP